MMKTKILFFIFDLGGGGAEKVLVNLVNNLSEEKYDIEVRTIFGKGVNAKNLKSHIKYSSFFKCKPFKGFTIFQRLFPPAFLYRLLIKGDYDKEIAFLQHSPTRIISGGKSGSKKYAWVHIDGLSYKAYKNLSEFTSIYSKFEKTAFVSKVAFNRFIKDFGFNPHGCVVHNVNETSKIKDLSNENILELNISQSVINLCSAGRFTPQKGYERLIPILGKLNNEGISEWHFYLLGEGEMKETYERLLKENKIRHKFTFLGYQENPYKFVKNMDLFVCSSREEGYSTVVTESIIVGTPVITTECSGMSEIFDDSGGGMIVENSEEALYEGLKYLLTHPEKIKEMSKMAEKRASYFSLEYAIKEFEDFIND